MAYTLEHDPIDPGHLITVTGELDIVRGLTESLRAQTHEAANRLHTVVSIIEIGRTEEAIDFVTDELKVAQMLTDRVVGAVGDPVVAALLLGKSAEAAERGISLTVTGANGLVQTFSATVQAGGTFAVDVPAALAQGPFNVTAIATDAAGNSASASDSGG